MRVVDVTSFFSSAAGGIKRYYREKARFLPALGVECHFVVPGEADGSEAFGDGTLHRLAGPAMPGNPAYRRFPGRARLAALIERLAPDVIELGSHYFLPGMIAHALRRLPRRPRLVGFFHSHPQQVVRNLTHFLPGRVGQGALERLAWAFFRWRHTAYDATLVASREMALLMQAHRIPRAHRVGLGVDTEVFRPLAEQAAARGDGGVRLAAPPGDGPLITYAGRFTVDKELELLLEAFPAVHARRGARLRFVGAGPLRARLEDYTRRQPGVAMGGYVDGPADIARALAESDVVVVPSQTETFSFTTAEALACATPVVGPDRGAVRELIEESGGGRLFTAGDAGSLAEALADLCGREPGARRALGAAGRAHILRELTWPRVVGRIHDVYRGVAAEPDAAAIVAHPHEPATP